MMLLVRLLPVRRQNEGRQGDSANFGSTFHEALWLPQIGIPALTPVNHSC